MSRVPRRRNEPLCDAKSILGLGSAADASSAKLDASRSHCSSRSGAHRALTGLSKDETKSQRNRCSGLANVRFCVKLPWLRPERLGGDKKTTGRFEARVTRGH